MDAIGNHSSAQEIRNTTRKSPTQTPPQPNLVHSSTRIVSIACTNHSSLSCRRRRRRRRPLPQSRPPNTNQRACRSAKTRMLRLPKLTVINPSLPPSLPLVPLTSQPSPPWSHKPSHPHSTGPATPKTSPTVTHPSVMWQWAGGTAHVRD